MVKSIVLAAGLALLVAVPEAATATVFDYTVNGFENAAGTLNPLTGFIDVDATSTGAGAIIDYDLLANGNEFKFDGITLQQALGGTFFLLGSNGLKSFALSLEDTTTLFSGLPTTIDSATSGIGGEGSFEGTLTLAAAVPELSTWAMMILGFCGLGFMAYRRKQNVPAFNVA